VEARPRHGVLGGGEVRQVRDTFFPGGRIFALELPIRLPAGHWQLRLGLPAGELAAVEATMELGEVTVALPNLTFEGGNIAGWQAEGEAFSGLVPTGEAAAGQQLVTGWRGRFFLNGYVRGDRPQGRLTSSPFALDRPVLTFLVGGGRLPGQLGVLLHVQGMQGAVREATGPGSERMERVSWDVSPWLGRQARIELLDRASGSWGHLLFDDVQLLPALSTGQGVPPAGEVQGGGGEVPAR